ncbi:hypothetical protein RN001_004852 [Aquatica leii]|uniref:Phorbol-ester/DAG-type domain-containing protein n=1 Tax=Aquatica leii TaxID=1421715 RepID=A0AAN7SPP0_9COLE|nr:hypothetical protein RN001_004852 [Aquatica leii]
MAKSKDTKLLITKLQFLVNKLDRFRNMINSIDPEICSELEFQSLEVRLDQNKSIANEYTELSAQASSFSITLENLPSYEEFEEEYFQLIAKASLILKNKDRCNSQSPSNSLNSSETLQSNCNVKLPMLNIPTKCSVCKLELHVEKKLKCDECGNPIHTTCSGLIRAEVQCLNLKDRRIKYVCELCNCNKVHVSDLIKIITEFKNEITALKKQSISPLSEATFREDLISELNERNVRARNVIVYGLNEPDDANTSTDIAQVKAIMDKIAPEVAKENIKVFRIGRRKNLEESNERVEATELS